jgi:hypothetical protein
MRLHVKGREGWRGDPEAEELMRFAIHRFADLAKKHGLDPDDGGSAAFEAMRNPSVVFGDDPWAVIVHAVNTTLAACQFADQALCSVDTARRGGLSGVCPQRFSEKDIPLWESDPAFHVINEMDGGDDIVDGLSIREQAEGLAGLFATCGWPLDATVTAVEVILRRLAEAGSRPAAYEQLRRETRWRAITDLPATSWTGLLRLLLGHPTDVTGVTDKGRGMLLRLALGETLEDLAADEALVAGIRLVVPRRHWRRT